MEKNYKKFFVLFVSIILFALAFKFIAGDGKEDEQLSYSQFIKEVKKKNIREVTLQGEDTIKGVFKKTDTEGKKISFKTTGNTGEVTLKFLVKYGIVPNYETEKRSFLAALIINWIPLILILFITYHLLKTIRPDKKKQHMDSDEDQTLLFDDVEKDEDNFFQEAVGRHDGFYIYDIWLNSSERKSVRKAVGRIKRKYKDQIKTKRSGEHIAYICKIFVNKEL